MTAIALILLAVLLVGIGEIAYLNRSQNNGRHRWEHEL